MKFKMLDNYLDKYLETTADSFEKGFINSAAIMTNGIDILGEWHEQNPLTENIYNTISSDLSLISYVCVQDTEDKYNEDIPYLKDLSKKLNLRPNPLQTAADMMDTFWYNVTKYGNGMLLITRDEYGNIKQFDSIDVGNAVFGFGYEEKQGAIYLVWQDKTSMETLSIPYEDVIHVRYIPAKIFDGDRFRCNNFNKITQVIDTNINSMITELSSGGKVKGVLKLKNIMSKNNSKSARSKQFIESVNSGIAVTDIGEEFQPLSKEFARVTPAEIDDIQNYMYRMFGINKNIIDGTFTFEEYSSYYNKTLEPLINRLSQELNYKLLDDAQRERGYKIDLIKLRLMGANAKDIAALFDKAIYEGAATPNEYRRALGFKPYEKGNHFYTNLNAVDLGTADNPIDSPNELAQVTATQNTQTTEPSPSTETQATGGGE